MNKKQEQRIIRKTIDRVSPVVLKQYKGDGLNSSELDKIVLTEIKKEYLRFLELDKQDVAGVLLNFIKLKPKFTIWSAGVFWIATIKKRPFDEFIFHSDDEKRTFIEFACSAEPERKDELCDIYGIDYF